MSNFVVELWDRVRILAVARWLTLVVRDGLMVGSTSDGSWLTGADQNFCRDIEQQKKRWKKVPYRRIKCRGHHECDTHLGCNLVWTEASQFPILRGLAFTNLDVDSPNAILDALCVRDGHN